MNKYQQAIASVAFLTLFLSAGLNIGLLESQRTKTLNRNRGRAELILNSFEDHNYNLWKSAVGNNAISTLIKKEDFNNFLASRNAIRSGQYDKALDLSAKLEQKLKDNISGLYLAS